VSFAYFDVPILTIIGRPVEYVYPRKRDIPRGGFLDAVVGHTKRQVESQRVEEVVSSGSVEFDLRRAINVRSTDLA
jgi:hypothetical protein